MRHVSLNDIAESLPKKKSNIFFTFCNMVNQDVLGTETVLGVELRGWMPEPIDTSRCWNLFHL